MAYILAFSKDNINNKEALLVGSEEWNGAVCCVFDWDGNCLNITT